MSVDDLMQVKRESMEQGEKTTVKDLFRLIPRAVCVAMGVAVAALGILGQIDIQKAIIMLGIGVACAGIALLEK